MDAAPTWQWKSTVLSELAALLQFLRLLRAPPHDQLRVFSSSRQSLEEQLEQENNGLASTVDGPWREQQLSGEEDLSFWNLR